MIWTRLALYPYDQFQEQTIPMFTFVSERGLQFYMSTAQFAETPWERASGEWILAPKPTV